MKMCIKYVAAAVLLSFLSSAVADVHYVDVNSTNGAAPYTNWATAAANIQAAVDAAVAGDEIVVTNGIYSSGGRAIHGTMTNRVAVDKPRIGNQQTDDSAEPQWPAVYGDQPWPSLRFCRQWRQPVRLHCDQRGWSLRWRALV